jgi:hypothetical protein
LHHARTIFSMSRLAAFASVTFSMSFRWDAICTSISFSRDPAPSRSWR